MKRASCLVVALLLSACGAGGEAAGESETPSGDPTEPRATGPVYDLHEWGVVAVRPGGFEVAAGAGQPRIEMNVDKPVLYVHSEEPAPFPLTVQVNLPDALHPVEHFPPTDLRPLRWHAEVGTAGCRGTSTPAPPTSSTRAASTATARSTSWPATRPPTRAA
jgi:hypothetical protein